MWEVIQPELGYNFLSCVFVDFWFLCVCISLCVFLCFLLFCIVSYSGLFASLLAYSFSEEKKKENWKGQEWG